ncbi:MAG: peroxiredoxin [Candidatus Methanomethylophilaceae archaeon]|nr:peroxiredoxin [Candidatus Methanomethylophilaceae archaeon]
MEKGDVFPAFRLRDKDGMEFDSSMLEGIRYVIYFYPRDGTAGCLKEAVEFSAAYPKFMMRNIPIIGVSKDSVESHKRFHEKNGLKIALLSDPEHDLIERAGAWGLKKFMGKESMGTIRSTFIVGKDGRVEAAWKGVKVDGHVEKVLETALSLVKNER